MYLYARADGLARVRHVQRCRDLTPDMTVCAVFDFKETIRAPLEVIVATD